MRTKLKLAPGKRGTKKLVRQYGDQLLCVRYRYDAKQRKRYKTVELIVDESPWEPGTSTAVYVRIAYKEPVLQSRVRAAGGVWSKKERLWKLPYGAVKALCLEDRIVRENRAVYVVKKVYSIGNLCL